MQTKYKQYIHVSKSIKYAQDVIDKKIVACKWVQYACKRFLGELKKQEKTSFTFQFNAERAENFCIFVELLPHVKGKWSGSNLTLEPWQSFLFTPFGISHHKFPALLPNFPRQLAEEGKGSGISIFGGETGAKSYFFCQQF